MKTHDLENIKLVISNKIKEEMQHLKNYQNKKIENQETWVRQQAILCKLEEINEFVVNLSEHTIKRRIKAYLIIQQSIKFKN
jgi:hypothetical protein